MTAANVVQTTGSAGAVTSVTVTPQGGGASGALLGGEMVVLSVEFVGSVSTAPSLSIAGVCAWTSEAATMSAVDSGGEYHYLQTWVGVAADTANGSTITVSAGTAPTAGWVVNMVTVLPGPSLSGNVVVTSGSGATGASYGPAAVNMGVNRFTCVVSHANSSASPTVSPGIWTTPVNLAVPSPSVGAMTIAWALTTTAAAPTASISYAQTSGPYVWHQIAFAAPIPVNTGKATVAAAGSRGKTVQLPAGVTAQQSARARSILMAAGGNSGPGRVGQIYPL